MRKAIARCLSFEPEERPDNPLSWIGTQLAESKQGPAGSDPVVLFGDENEAAAKAKAEPPDAKLAIETLFLTELQANTNTKS
eukprot:COSAG02_NODE_26371_length_634_cov_1.472897_1_plen_81_part_01